MQKLIFQQICVSCFTAFTLITVQCFSIVQKRPALSLTWRWVKPSSVSMPQRKPSSPEIYEKPLKALELLVARLGVGSGVRPTELGTISLVNSGSICWRSAGPLWRNMSHAFIHKLPLVADGTELNMYIKWRGTLIISGTQHRPKAQRESVKTYHIGVIWRSDSLVVEVVPVYGGKEHMIFNLQLQNHNSWHINCDTWPDKQFHNDKDIQMVTHKISNSSNSSTLIFLQESVEQVTRGLRLSRWQVKWFMQDCIIHLWYIPAVEWRLFVAIIQKEMWLYSIKFGLNKIYWASH